MNADAVLHVNAAQFARLYRGIRRRDPRLDGRVWVAVRTTGIYCLPSCPARKPHARNVRFYGSRGQAEAAGFRPCRKCRPEVLGGQRALEQRRVHGWLASLAENEQPVRDLAKANGASASRVYRAFRRQLGRGPRQARGEVRLQRACRELRHRRAKVTDVAYDAGFGSLATFYRWFRRMTGMTPTEFRGRGSRVARIERRVARLLVMGRSLQLTGDSSQPSRNGWERKDEHEQAGEQKRR